jgi:hypothetical protein
MSRSLIVVPDQRAHSMHKNIESPDFLASMSRRKFIKPTPENPLIVSAGELGEFLRCRVRHYWSYHCKLEPKGIRLPLVMGKVGHQILDRFYQFDYSDRTENRMKKIAHSIIKKTNPKQLPLPDKQLLEAMTIGYAAWNRKKSSDNSDIILKLRKRMPEMEFMLPLTDDNTIWVRGRMDLLFQPGCFKNTLAFIESKFKASIKMDNTEQKIQLSVYLWAMMKLFPDYKRYIAYPQVLRKQMPGPRVKADLFAREPVERTPAEIRQWGLDAARTALDMIDGAVYPNPMDSCSWMCDFQKPCLLRGDKKDLKYVLKDNYQKKEWSK